MINTFQAVHWPFQSICDQFVADLFNPRWETRHGAAIGLREIISCHGKGAGKTANTSDEQVMATTIMKKLFNSLPCDY